MASVNEYSARYSILDKEFYFPAPENIATQAENNKQGRAEAVSPEIAERVLHLMREDAQRNYDHYLEFLGGSDRDEEDFGISRELARINLTLNTYTQWYWKCDLHNLMGFLQLRADPHAQLEIRNYAKAIMNIVKAWVPLAYEAFEEYRYGAVTLSRTEISILSRLLGGEEISELRAEISKREWEMLVKTFGLELKA
jgi:thymidylate synthase (FAD)